MLAIVGWVVIFIVTAFAVVILTLDDDLGLKRLSFILFSSMVAGLLWAAICCVSFVSTGHVMVTSWFGSVRNDVYGEGIAIVNPLMRTAELSIQRRTVDFSDNKSTGSYDNPVNGPSVGVITKDQNTLHVDISLPYAVRPANAWILYQRIGQSDRAIESKLIETNARTAVTAAFSATNWVEATTTEREATAKLVGTEFSSRVYADLMTYGLSDAEARASIVFGEPQIREIVLEEKLRNSINDRLATLQLLDRQKTLTEIAELEAQRRAKEGSGISQLFNALPKDFKASDISLVLTSLAAKEQADALLKAVENGKVQIFPVPVGSAIAQQPAQTLKDFASISK